MRKLLFGIAVLVAVAIPAVGIAADLQSSHIGSFCPKSAGLVQWHFVNNQTGGASEGTLYAYFDIAGADQNGPAPGDITLTDADPKVLRSVLHFNVYTDFDATLVGATTGAAVPGKLVLSDSCKK